MKTLMKAQITLLSMALSASLFAEVGITDLQDIERLLTEGKYEEANQKHILFHEASKKSKGMGGVRLSFALSQWLELGEKYPKALHSLKNIRDTNEKTLLEGNGDFPEFQEYASINNVLKEDEKTYALFKYIHSKYPDTAKVCFDIALDLIISHKDYELCRPYITDPIKSYEDIRHRRESNLSSSRSNPNLQDVHFIEYTNTSFVDEVSKLIEIMVNLKLPDAAKEIQSRALGYFPDQKIKAAIPAN